MIVGFLACSSLLEAAGEIQIQGTRYVERTSDRYFLEGLIENTTEDPREVVVRAQLSFFERGVPAGDVPVFILRKDLTLILKPGEGREMKIPLVDEGTRPKTALRIEPMLRVRRQREWVY